jgi:hypothetical protein
MPALTLKEFLEIKELNNKLFLQYLYNQILVIFYDLHENGFAVRHLTVDNFIFTKENKLKFVNKNSSLH